MRVRFVILVVASLAACADAPPRADAAEPVPDDGPLLELDEARVIALPPERAVIGVAAAGDGRIAAWTARQLIVTDTGGAPLPTADIAARPIAAWFDSAGALEVVDGHGGRVHRFLSDGSHAGFRELGVPVRIGAAARAPGGWAVGGAGEDGRYRVYAAGDGPPRLLLTIDPDTLLARRLSSYRLDPARDAVLVSEAELPFRVWRVGRDGSAAPAMMPRGVRDRVTTRGERERWVALSVVEVGGGYLQTLADLASDRRLLVLMGRDGSTLRITEVAAPLGIAGTSADGEYVVGVRQADGWEAVLYRWRWNASNESHGEEP